MKKITRVLFGCFILQLVSCAHANDSTARVGAGGITFLKSEDIKMAQEVLEISTKSIKIQYLFHNESSKDIQATIAFPLPSYRWNSGESADEINVKPLRPFTTRVDGHPVPNTITKKATIKGRDVTGILRKIGLTDKQIFETFAHCPEDYNGKHFELCDLTKKQQASLKKLGDWEVSETALWEQVFPGNKTIEVLHEYVPFVGESYSRPYQGRFGYVSDDWIKSGNSEACVDEGVRSAIHKQVKAYVDKGATSVSVYQSEVEYILGTGRNWKGPIEDFKLRIKNESPDQLVSLCFPGKPKRVSATVLEFTQKNYIPQDKLVIYFYSVYGVQPKK